MAQTKAAEKSTAKAQKKTASAVKSAAKTATKTVAKKAAKTEPKKEPVKKAVCAKSAPAKKTTKTATKTAKKSVTVKADCPLATTVAIAGSFNEWNVSANLMKKGKDGIWSVKLSLVPGSYEYKFVCDGINWDEGENKILDV